MVSALNDHKADESLVPGQNGAHAGDTSSERTARDGEVTMTLVTAASEQTQEADEAREGAAGHPDIVLPAKPTSDALEETGEPARIEPSDRDDDVGAGTAAEVAEERLDISSAKLTASAGGGNAEERSDFVEPTIDVSDAPEQTSSSHEGVEGQRSGGHDAEKIQDDAGVPEPGLQEDRNETNPSPCPKDTVWVEDEIICMQGDGSNFELSDISESNDEVKCDSDTDGDNEVAVAAGLKRNTCLQRSQPQAKASRRTGMIMKKKKS
ncbi:hypothetical protein V5O48_013494 [Marasmius crinis-equi]|uniref:Uncharacterized protein n=1 Tax=Marasmius crinis-equi TaxID=585013 RepID=A0ABR3F0B4_9AGAR